MTSAPLTPMWDNVILELRPRSDSKIVLPENAHMGHGTGIYVNAIGDKKRLPDGQIVTVPAPPFHVGDEVQAKTEGMVKIELPKQPLEREGRKFIICAPENIVCVIAPNVFAPHQ